MPFVQTDADLRSLIAGARDIIYACDAAGHFTFANPFAVELMGYPEAEILGRHFLTLVRDDHKEGATKFYGRQFVARVLDTYFEFPAVLKGGDGIWLGQHVQLIIEGDRITGFQAIARDITKQKDAEAQLKESEAAYRSLVHGASIGIFRSTTDGRFLDVNPALARMLGYDAPSDVIALQDIAGLYVNPAERASLVDELMRVGQITDAEVKWKRRGGRAAFTASDLERPRRSWRRHGSRDVGGSDCRGRHGPAAHRGAAPARAKTLLKRSGSWPPASRITSTTC